MKLLHINQILDDCEDFGYINCDRDSVDSIEFESIIHYLKEYKDFQLRFDKLKDYLRQVHKEAQSGILSSNNLIWENIERLCDGLDILEKE